MQPEEEPQPAESEICWICLEGATDKAPLARVCACPRPCHEACLARWQLHSAGRSEETSCRFCGSTLADWRPHMTGGARVATPYMRVSFNGRTHKVPVRPGEDGAREFENTIRSLLQLPPDQEFDVIFHCRAPNTGDKLQLQGLCAFDAAVHCASMSSSTPGSPAADAAAAGGGKAESRAFGGLLQRLVQRIAGRFDLPVGAGGSASGQLQAA